MYIKLIHKVGMIKIGNITKQIFASLSICSLIMTVGMSEEIYAACENPGWAYGYYKNDIVINTIRLPEYYVDITNAAISDWNKKSTGYTIRTTAAPVSAYGTGAGKNYVSAYSLDSNSVTGRTSMITTRDSSKRKGTSFLIVYNTQCYDYNNLSGSQKKKFCRSVMGHELGHVMSLADMDTKNENKYGKTSIMSYSRDRYTLISPTDKDATWVKYYK